MVLAASLWAWAIGANVLYGVVSGAVLGLGAAIYLDESFNESHDTGGVSGGAKVDHVGGDG